MSLFKPTKTLASWTSHKILFLPLIDTKLEGDLLFFYLQLLNTVRFGEFSIKDPILLKLIQDDVYPLINKQFRTLFDLSIIEISNGKTLLNSMDTNALFNLSVYALSLLLFQLLLTFTKSRHLSLKLLRSLLPNRI